MKVLLLAEGGKYDVWALCGNDDSCQVLEVLKLVRAEHPDLVDAITAHLYESVPEQGPFLDGIRGKMLYRDILFELKEDKSLGRRARIGLRIVFFYDDEFSDGPVVVCTTAFIKHSSSTPISELDKALSLRGKYFQEKDELEFVEIPGHV